MPDLVAIPSVRSRWGLKEGAVLAWAVYSAGIEPAQSCVAHTPFFQALPCVAMNVLWGIDVQLILCSPVQRLSVILARIDVSCEGDRPSLENSTSSSVRVPS